MIPFVFFLFTLVLDVFTEYIQELAPSTERDLCFLQMIVLLGELNENLNEVGDEP